MATFLALLAGALAYAAVLTLAALGFLLLYKATGVVNFAHGDLLTLGGFLAWWAIDDLGLPVVPGSLLAIVLLAGVGVVLERVAYAPLRKRPQMTVVVATLAAALVIRASIGIWQGSEPRRLPSPVGDGAWHVAGAAIAWQRVLIVGVTAVVVALLMYVFRYTSFGRQVRALAADPDAARLCGVRVRRVSMIAWALSGALAALAGILVAPLTVLDLNFGFAIMLGGMAAAVAGGFGSLRGAVVGCLGVGLIQQLVGGYWLRDYAGALPYAALFLVIVIRPQGIVATPASRL
ncbi:branched-chain amino acid ABC transporter permease [Yinghuangia seranimata]|uniref:branched-chain amino acid ABC transporter permease n=1 Tax=Yinghuangia seranimata TaxID=408067 RepID=UPI00248D261E|nr:branched-chain amino acid ABC transporter permease [Yinghuangia seranimata]MDI2127315.1 branched-chain amino acid ABC transporter permease [Yinghuangia seranimata]